MRQCGDMKLPQIALLLTVCACQPLAFSYVEITTASLPNGTVQTPYSATIQADHGCTPYQWAVTSGNLPAGITYAVSTSTTSLNLIGSPTGAGTYSFTVTVMGCGKHTSTTSLQVVIQAAQNHVVDLNWEASTSEDIAGYNVYRGPDGVNWTKITDSPTASTVYADSAVADDTTYYYSTTAVDTYGEESAKSAPVMVVIP